MFERFTDEARQVVVAAQDHARRLRAERIEPVHLLLALSDRAAGSGHVLRSAGADSAAVEDAVRRTGSDLDADALAALGIDLASVRAATDAAFGPGALEQARPEPPGHLSFADGSKRALERTLLITTRAGKRRIGSCQLLCGLLDVGDPGVSRVLHRLGIDTARLREQAAGPAAA